jgi:hypothetical protein
MSTCKDCKKAVKEGYFRCFECNKIFKENKKLKTEGETTDETQINYYKFGRQSKQDLRADN